MNKPIIALSICSLALLIGLIIALRGLDPSATQPALPVYGEAPEFELIDSSGASFNSKNLDNHVWVTDFFFTNCGGPCPTMSKHMAELHKAYLSETGVRFVSISVDPNNDTPEALHQYARKFDADVSRWHFLTGEAETLHQVAFDGFKLVDPENLMLHSPKFALIDRQGQVRGYYDGTAAEEMQTLSNDIRRLLKEKGK